MDTKHTTFTETENPNKVVLHTKTFEVLKNKDKSHDPKQWDVFFNNLQASVWRKVSDERRDPYQWVFSVFPWEEADSEIIVYVFGKIAVTKS